MFTAPGLASKARQYFEKAVQLNPRNLEALTDLFEYYLEAPGFLGGGLDKAEATSARIAEIDAAEGYWAHAKLAEKRKEFQWRRRSVAARHRGRSPADRPVDRSGAIPGETGPRSGGRPEPGRAEKINPNSPKLCTPRPICTFSRSEIWMLPRICSSAT